MKAKLAYLIAAAALVIGSLGASKQTVKEDRIFQAGVEAGRAERQAEVDALKAQLAEVRSDLSAQLRVTWDGRQWVQLDESMQRVSRVWAAGSWVEASSSSPGSDASPCNPFSACDRGGCSHGVCLPQWLRGGTK